MNIDGERTIARVFVPGVALYFLALSAAQGMEFSLVHNTQDDIMVIVGEGEIKEGDEEKLSLISAKAGRDEYGNIPIYLDSPGGSVSAAFKLAAFMQEQEFSALIGSGSRCASACAAILYLSARFHQVLGSGLLGLHTCYAAIGDSSPEPSALCNQYIFENAFNAGTSVGAVSSYIRNTSPYDMVWIGREVACSYGLCGPPGFDDTKAVPSFRCTGALNAVEAAICSDRRLARHEASLARLYRERIERSSDAARDTLRRDQRQWLRERDTCSVPALEKCVLEAMNARRDKLSSTR